MVMETLQIRLTKGLIDEIQALVDKDIYSSTSEAVRDAVRRLILGSDEKIEIPEKVETQKKIQKEVSEQFKKPLGTTDFYPEDMKLKNYIFNKFQQTAEKYNFNQVETPAFENLNLLSKKEGEEIQKQIFTLEKRGDEEFGLRFDLTVPCARMFVEKQKELAKPVKWFYLSRMWRYERPQKGRLREFYQYGVELYGSDKAQADTEVISLLIDSLKSLGLTEKEFVIRINNRKLLEGVLKEVTEDKVFETIAIIDKKSKITEEEFEKELQQLGLDQTQVLKVKTIVESSLASIECKNDLAKEGKKELQDILELLGSKKEFIELDLSTARGLAYYTGTVFEAFDRNGKFRALAGGGRYNNMIEMFKGEPTPATGFAMGLSTIQLLLDDRSLIPTMDEGPDYYIAVIGNVKKQALDLANDLRYNKKVEIDLQERNIGKQFKYANAIKAKKVIVVGEDEIKEKLFTVKDMSTGTEEKVKKEDLLQ